MDFRTFFLGLAPSEREAYAGDAQTGVPTLLQVAYGNKQVELGFADVLVALAGGNLSIDDMPLTERAAKQHAIRVASGTAPKVPKVKAARAAA